MYPNGGSETYIFKLGEALEQHGHEVQYFGMEHEGRCVVYFAIMTPEVIDFLGGAEYQPATICMQVITLAVVPLGIGNVACSQVLTPLGKEILTMAAGIGSRFGTGIKQLEPVDASNHIIMDYSIHDAIPEIEEGKGRC